MSRFRVVALDMRGHGNSDRDPDANYNSQTFTADLAKAIAAFGFERTILIGHSWGAETAIRFAAANPGQIAALVIVDFGPELDQTGVDEVLKGFNEMPRAYGSADEFARWLTARRPLAEPRLLAQFARYSLRQAAGLPYEIKIDDALGTHSELSRLVAQNGRYYLPGLWAELARIKCPSLVIRGAMSAVFPTDVAARMVERTLPVSRLQTIRVAGHAVMLDNPAQFTSSVEAFLSKRLAAA